MNRFALLLLALCGAGLLTGFGAARVARSSPDSTGGQPLGKPSKSISRSVGELSSRERSISQVKPARPSSRSKDSLEDLKALDGDALYGRLALWLMDASEGDIAAYWKHHLARETQKRDITDLMMIGWTRVNPQGAIAAVAGTNNEHYAWWAWSCHDPQAALDAAMAAGPDRVNNVTWGIGEFHPKWLRENFDSIPESAQGNAISGLIKWGEVDDAMATLEFLKERGRTPPKDLLKNLVRQDPWAAYDWFEQNGDALGSQYGGRDQAMNLLIDAMADAHPEVLDQLIAQEPSGRRRWKMEDAAFRNLLKLDLDAAWEEATDTPAPLAGAQRMASVGLRLIRTDPDRAYEVAADLFAKFPNALSNYTTVYYPGGSSSSSGGSGQEAGKLLHALVAHDPVRSMEMYQTNQLAEEDAVGGASGGASVGAVLSGAPGGNMGDQIASIWAQRDVEDFAEWVVEKNNPETTSQSAPIIASQLQNQQRFDEAAEWVMEMGESRRGHLRSFFRSWVRAQPEQAQQWLESADLPEADQSRLQRYLEQSP